MIHLFIETQMQAWQVPDGVLNNEHKLKLSNIFELMLRVRKHMEINEVVNKIETKIDGKKEVEKGITIA